MEQLFPDSVKMILLGLLAAVIVLSWLAKRMPHIAWLQNFRLPENRLTPAQRERLRKSQNRMAGVEFMLLGVIAPFGLIVLSLMFFSEPSTMEWVLVGAFSIVCVALGITALVKNR
jgi:L-asparagine transporter-like permease